MTKGVSPQVVPKFLEYLKRIPFSEELPNGLRNLPDVAQYGARANPCAAGASNKEASRVCLSYCKNCIHVA